MARYQGTFESNIDAAVHTVFEYCRDPRLIYSGDPSHTVTEATVAPEGVGTSALVVSKVGIMTEEIAIEYVELVPDRLVVFEAYPKMIVPRLGGRVLSEGPLHTWTWTFTPEGDGTRLTLVVVSGDASWWESALDRVTGKLLSRMFEKEIRERLSRIKARVEEHSGAFDAGEDMSHDRLHPQLRVGTHYSWTARIAGVPIDGFNVFIDFVPDRHITDRSSNSLEGTWTYSFEPDGSGTKLTVENKVGSFWRLPPLERLLDRVAATTHEPRLCG